MANKYMNSAERAEENRSSAWTLLLVGGGGLLISLLGALGIIPIPMQGAGKVMSFTVLGGLCFLFVIMGIVSFRKSKVYSEQAAKEGDRESKVFSWFEENWPAEKIDELLAQQLYDLPEEEKYFKRYAVVRQLLFQNFSEIGMEFLDHMADEVYEKIFGEE